MISHAPRPRRLAVRARLGGATHALAALLALTLPLMIPPHTHAASMLIGDADVHVDVNTGRFEINVSISQTQNNCGTRALNGQVCLRYSIASNDTAIASGYGLIASSAVQVTGSSITFSPSTRFGPSSGVISVTWKALPGALPMTADGNTSTLSPCSIQGSVFGYKLTGTLVQAHMLIYAS